MLGDAPIPDPPVEASAPTSPPRVRFPAWLAIPVGALLSFLAFFGARNAETARIRREFELSAALRANAIRQGFDHFTWMLGSVRAFFRSSVRVERHEFKEFTTQLRSEFPELQGLAWVPRVRAAERAAIEARAREEGLRDFGIREADAGGAIAAAAERDDYYPIFFLEPLEGNEAVCGFDLGATAEHRKALVRTAESGLAATFPLNPLRGRGPARFAMSLPVPEAGAAAEGFALLVFDIGDFVDHVLQRFEPASYQLTLTGPGGDEESPPIAWRPAARRDPSPPPASPAAMRASARLHWRDVFPAAGAVWTVECAADRLYIDNRRGALPPATLGGALLFTGLVALAFGVREARSKEMRRAEDRLSHQLSERGAAETALHENRRMLTTLLGNLPGVVYRCRNDRAWTLEFVSDGCVALTGYPASELLSNRVTFGNHLILPEDRDRVWATVQESVDARRPWQLIYRIRDAWGEEKWVWEQGRGVHDSAGRLVALEGFLSDWTERHRTEEALRAQERILRILIEHTPAAVAMLDGSLRYIVTSRRWLSDHGLPGSDLLGIGLAESLPWLPETVRGSLDRALAGSNETGEFVSPRGRIRYEARPWRRADGSIGGLMLFHEK